MKTVTQADADTFFPILAELIEGQEFKTSVGTRSDVVADEFMLMWCDNETAAFKHRDTRNYVYLRKPRMYVDGHPWELDIPVTKDHFHFGLFDKIELPTELQEK
jgi:hypothetical protein